jgi:hypothetical protein
MNQLLVTQLQLFLLHLETNQVWVNLVSTFDTTQGKNIKALSRDQKSELKEWRAKNGKEKKGKKGSERSN